VPVADIIAVERDPFDKRNVRNIALHGGMQWVFAERQCQRVVN
jgi:hypothetical protein